MLGTTPSIYTRSSFSIKTKISGPESIQQSPIIGLGKNRSMSRFRPEQWYKITGQFYWNYEQHEGLIRFEEDNLEDLAGEPEVDSESATLKT